MTHALTTLPKSASLLPTSPIFRTYHFLTYCFIFLFVCLFIYLSIICLLLLEYKLHEGRNVLFFFLSFWLLWVLVAVCGLSLVAVSRGYSSLRCVGFSLQWLLLLWSAGSRRAGSVVVAHGL